MRSALLGLAAIAAAGTALPARAFDLTILHINDFHSRVEPISKSDGPCSETRIGVPQRRHGRLPRPYTQWVSSRRMLPVVDCSGWSRFARISRYAVASTFGTSGTSRTGVHGEIPVRNSVSPL